MEEENNNGNGANPPMFRLISSPSTRSLEMLAGACLSGEEVKTARAFLLSNILHDEAMQVNFRRLFKINLESCPPGMEPVVEIKASLSINDARKVLEALPSLPGIHKWEKGGQSADFLWWRQFPGDNAGPAAEENSAPVETLARFSVFPDNSMEITTNSKTRMIAVINLIRNNLEGAITLCSLKFKNLGEADYYG